MFKKFLLAAMLLFPMLASAQSLKIGVVDASAILAAMPETTSAQNTIQEMQKKYEADYNKLTNLYCFIAGLKFFGQYIINKGVRALHGVHRTTSGKSRHFFSFMPIFVCFL